MFGGGIFSWKTLPEHMACSSHKPAESFCQIPEVFAQSLIIFQKQKNFAENLVCQNVLADN